MNSVNCDNALQSLSMIHDFIHKTHSAKMNDVQYTDVYRAIFNLQTFIIQTGINQPVEKIEQG